jgi:predicted ATPase
VDLANIREPSLVLPAIANVLNIAEKTDAALTDILKRELSRKHLLLLMDNLEHLLESARLISELLAVAPQLSVLGTSREMPDSTSNLPRFSNLSRSKNCPTTI